MAGKQDFTPLTYKKVHPEIDVQNYLFSKAQGGYIKKKPEWDVARRAPDGELVAKKRLLYDVEQKLKDKRIAAKQIRANTDAKWKELEDKEKILRENFIKFNKFVKENQEKRERAEHKISEEVALIKKRSEDIEELQNKYEYMSTIRTGMEQNIKNHSMYEGYLTEVVKYSKAFKFVTDTLDRYEALVDAKSHLAERHNVELRELEEAQNELMKITEEKTIILMHLNYLVAELEGRYEIAINKALQWEAMVIKIKDISVLKIAELDQVKRSAWNVYLQMCKRKEIEASLTQDDFENQLVFIKQTLYEMKKITRIAKRRAVKDGILKPSDLK